jgi:hypothetical protein
MAISAVTATTVARRIKEFDGASLALSLEIGG